jgi:DNA-binding NarL/FixJ family response regulator
MIRVLVADDHAVVRKGLCQILAETDDIVVEAEASTVEEARTLAREKRWDVLILDLNMPGGTGLDLLADLKREHMKPQVLVLTVASEKEYAVRAIRAGAAGFLNKESAPEALVEAVRRVASGGRYLSPDAADALASAVAGESGGEPHELLSDRELEVFKLLAGGRTVSQISEALSLSVKTVSTHRARLLRKLGMETNAELMRYAMKRGLV